ncbi:MAG: sensor histidine kinase, partial [Planctomycetaceae bacterium]
AEGVNPVPGARKALRLVGRARGEMMREWEGSSEHAQGDALARVAGLEAELAATRRSLLEARKLATLGELLGTTTHEFNNVLTTILNYARLGLRHPDAPTRDKAFDRILSAGTRAAKISASILSMARGGSDRMEPTNVESLVEDVLVLHERELMKYRVRVEREFTPTPRIRANPGQLQQLLLNLLVNARQAMPEGGRLILRLSADDASGMVELTVRDTGCGMPPEIMHRIFEPRFTTKQGPDETGKGGTGLGLSACREIVEAHGGRIRVESSPGRGTAITVRFPFGPKTVASTLKSSTQPIFESRRSGVA